MGLSGPGHCKRPAVLAAHRNGPASGTPAHGIQHFSAPSWMPDGKQVVFAGNDGQGWRIYTQNLIGGTPQPVTPVLALKPERFEGNLVSPDGRYVYGHDSTGRLLLYSLAGVNRPVPGTGPGDVWLNWTRDGRSAYLFQWGEIPARIFRIDLQTGKKELIGQFAPQDQAGTTAILSGRITADGRHYAYTYESGLSELFVVDGVK
jgi:Tol biopolymer transport system component